MRFLILLLLSVASNNLFGQTKLTCSKFRTGKFEVMAADGLVMTIDRTENLQTETINGVSSKYDVVWVDDCSYKLIPRFVIENTEIDIDSFLFTIIKMEDHSYTLQIISGNAPNLSMMVLTVYESDYR